MSVIPVQLNRLYILNMSVIPVQLNTFVYTQHVSHTSTVKHVYTTGYRFTIALTQNVKLRNHFLS